MANAREWLEFGQMFHGHKCPAMPNGLRAGAAAMNKLGVKRTGDGALHAIVEIGSNHCGTCYADGVQVITGCTFGKGNIEKNPMGKWGLTLIDKKTNRAVRVVPKTSMMNMTKESSFIKDYRSKGVPATQVPPEVVEPLIEKVISTPDDEMFNISEVFTYEWREPQHSYESFICEECGEFTVMPYGRIKHGKKVCMACAAKH